MSELRELLASAAGYAATGRVDDALAAYREALARSPSQAELHHNLGVLLFSKGEIAAAEREEHIARESSNAAERRLAAAHRQLQHADLALRLGATDLLEQLGAQIIVAQAELEVLQMRAQLQAARNNLEDALRTPLSGPELALGAET